MIWRILGIIGAGSFFVNGLSLLSDPSCVTADFGGGRVVQVTCRADSSGAFTGIQAGLVSLLIGFGLIGLIFFNSIKHFFVRRSLPAEIQSISNNNEETLVDIKLCDYCESNVPLDLQVCPKCEGTNFNYKSVSIPNSASQKNGVIVGVTDGQTKKCPSCAEEIKFEAIKCRYCQHSFEKTSVQKFNAKTESAIRNAFSSKYIGYTVSLIIIGITVLGFGLNARSNSIEMKQLLTSGEICVYNEDLSINFGCADYPQIKAKICSDSPAYLFFFPDLDYKNLSPRMASDFSCSRSEIPYGFTVVSELSEGIGDYKITGIPYADLAIEDYLEDGIYINDLFARISLKQ